jgi:hypothetical protein
MSDNSASLVLAEVVTRIFEDAAFVFADSMQASTPDPDAWQPIGFKLSFTGMASGVLRMWADREFAACVAANMLGLEGNDASTPEAGEDALRELLNMVTGNFLTEEFGEEPIFTLGLPETCSKDLLEADVKNPCGAWFNAEGTPVLFCIDLI